MSCSRQRRLDQNRGQTRRSWPNSLVDPFRLAGRGRPHWLLLAILMMFGALVACRPVDDPQISYDPANLAFSGPRALEIQGEFVGSFPNRASGEINNELAAEWVRDQMTDLDWRCAVDEWEVVNDSRNLPLQNVLCLLPGQSEQIILVVAHHDQSPETVQGADNDGSGIAIMLHLAEIFAAEEQLPHSLLFMSSDGEEYGMLGTRRLVSMEDDLDQIMAAISLDNLGKWFYDGLEMSPIGQFRGYGPLWLQRLAQESARAAGDSWIPQIRAPLFQALNQAVPISFMDQGPLVAAGVPAFGLAATVPADYADLHWETFHSPGDTMELQSADVLQQAGLATEALIRQLNTMTDFPAERGPYLYDQERDSVLRGLPLWLLFLAFGALFVVASVLTGRKLPGGFGNALKIALPHFVSLWLPLTGALLILYIFVEIGLMDSFAVYPAAQKDPDMINPRWLAVILWLVGFWELLQLGRRLAGLYMTGRPAPTFAHARSLALLIVGLGAFYIAVINPFTLLLIVPLLLWLLIGGRSGLGRVLDWLLFLAGGLIIYLLVHVFGFQVLRIDLAILWYLMMMFSIQMVSFPTGAIIAAMLAAGLSLVVKPAIGRRRTEARKAAAEATPSTDPAAS